jgi:hypothetical protein
MTDRIRIIKHEAVPGCGSFEVRFPTIGPARISIGTTSRPAGLPETLDRETALEQAKAVARGAETA